jgi:hypothetical protein
MPYVPEEGGLINVKNKSHAILVAWLLAGYGNRVNVWCSFLNIATL